MKFLKYLFFLILIVFISGTVYFGAQDGKYNIAVTKSMEVPTSLAFNTVNDFEAWKQWGPWTTMDPEIKITMGDTTAGVNASYSWESEHPDVGTGAIRNINNVANTTIEQEISFKKSYGTSTATMYWDFEPQTGQKAVTVTWGVKGELGLLDKIYGALFSSNSKTPTSELYNRGLESMERYIKDSMKEFTVRFDGISQYGGGYYLYLTASSNKAGVYQKKDAMVAQIKNYMQSNNIGSGGIPFTIFNHVDPTTGNLIFSASVPVNERITTATGSDVLCGFMPPLTAIKTTLMGDLVNLDKAFNKGAEYIAEKALEKDPIFSFFEVYIQDSSNSENPADWVTHVYIPILPPQETIN